MAAYETLNKAIKKRGISVAELSRRCNINAELLRRSLQGTRKIPADEFLTLCYELELKLKDFLSKEATPEK